MVVSGLERRARLEREPLDVVRRTGAGAEAAGRRKRPTEQCAGFVAGRSGAHRRVLGDDRRASHVDVDERHREVHLEVDVEPRRSGQLEGSLQRPAPPGSWPRQKARRPAAASFGGCSLCELRVGLPQLGEVAGRLLEVVAQDLVQLDEIGPCSSSQPAKRSCRSARIAFGSAS